MNSYSYGRNNPITLSDPQGTCPWCVPFLVGGLAGGVGTYIGDIFENQRQGLTGLAAYAPRSSWEEYNTAVVSGSLVAVTAVYSLTAGAVVAVGGSAAQDVAGGREVDPNRALLAGGTTFVAGGVFRGLMGPSPATSAMRSGGASYSSLPSSIIKNDARYVVTGETFQMAVGNIAQNNYQTRTGSNSAQSQGGGSASASGGISNGLLSSISRTLSAISSLISSIWRR